MKTRITFTITKDYEHESTSIGEALGIVARSASDMTELKRLGFDIVDMDHPKLLDHPDHEDH